MSEQRLKFVAPSGRGVEIGLSAEAPCTAQGAQVRFAGGSLGRSFMIGGRGYHDSALRDMMPGAVNIDRFLVHGREVVLAEGPKGGALASLIGEYHEISTVFGGAAPPRATVIELFSALEISDSPEGMVVTTNAPTLLDAMNEVVVVAVAGRGVLSVPGLQQAASVRPAHRGAATRHGEVWRWQPANTKDGVTGQMYVFGGPRGLAEIKLSGGDGVTDQQLLDWLDRVDVVWSGSA